MLYGDCRVTGGDEDCPHPQFNPTTGVPARPKCDIYSTSHPQMSIHMTFADALSGIVRHFYIDPTRFQAVFLTIQLSHSLAGLASLRGEQHILHVFVIDVI